jgi:VanZ family protein
LAIALLASAVVVFGSPYVGQIRAAVQTAFPAYYRPIILGTIAAALVTAGAFALFRIRNRRRLRYLCLATAAIVGVSYALATSTGNADVDAVERFHFVEYGALTFLYNRAWRRRGDITTLVLPACATFVVGILDEGVQWFVPTRVGELHDVLLNGAAIACGLLFSAGVEFPDDVVRPAHRGSRLIIGAALASVVLMLAVFVDRAHLGYENHDATGRTFRSQYDGAALARASIDRRQRWGSRRPPVERGLAREDHYLSEGEWHVQRRNTAVGRGDAGTAWNENAILETHYGPVLDETTRWPDDQREAVRRQAAGTTGAYVSTAEPYPIFVISRGWFWSATAVAAGGILAAAWASAARARL